MPSPELERLAEARLLKREPPVRADKRYLVFQALPHTLGVEAPTWRLLDRCHRERNQTEYEGHGHVDEKLLAGLVDAARELQASIRSLELPPETGA
jgi:hypothetical protein